MTEVRSHKLGNRQETEGFAQLFESKIDVSQEPDSATSRCCGYCTQMLEPTRSNRQQPYRQKVAGQRIMLEFNLNVRTVRWMTFNRWVCDQIQKYPTPYRRPYISACVLSA